MRILDLFCGAGGAAMGYHRAFPDAEIVGVDIHPQPRYPFTFVQADATSYPLDGFDFVHASPPCQDHSALKGMHEGHGTGWMLGHTYLRLLAHAEWFVVENVMGARIDVNPLILCGSMFELGVRRHRQFWTSFPVAAPACRHDLQPEPIDVTGTGGPSTRPRSKPGGGVSRKPRDLAHARDVMGIGWMNRRELSQAIPPAYTQYVGEQLAAWQAVLS